MPKLNSIILCDEIEFGAGGKLHIHGIFDSIIAPSFPAVHSSLTIFVHMDIEPGKHKQSYEIKRDEDSKVIFSCKEEGFTAESNRHQFIYRLNKLYIEKEGKYVVNVYINGKLFAANYFLAQKK